jgi:hypothetical protein
MTALMKFGMNVMPMELSRFMFLKFSIFNDAAMMANSELSRLLQVLLKLEM